MGTPETAAFVNSGSFGGSRSTATSVNGKKAHFYEPRDKINQIRRGGRILMRHGRQRTSVSRRTFNYLSLSSLTLGNFFHLGVSHSAQAVNSLSRAQDDLTKRINARITQEPVQKLYQSDIFYPDYFKGLWRTESTLLAVECPAGYKLFGRPGSFEAAKAETGKPLQYQSRFIRVENDVISDRPFNVTSIAEASMGASSVLDCSSVGPTPNRVIMTIRPNAAEGAVFNVDLRIIARRQQMDIVPGNLENRFGMERRETVDIDEEPATSCEFGLYTSETIRQEVRPNTDDLRVMPLIKDVETISVFVTDPRDENRIRGWQKTSVYFTKSDLRYPDARGRPVDVRWYRINYLRE